MCASLIEMGKLGKRVILAQTLGYFQANIIAKTRRVGMRPLSPGKK
jgi:hypothetical protein